MTASLAPVFVFRAFTANGTPLAGGKLYSYAAGTSTPLATWTDSTGTVAAANPLILDANGQTALWIGGASYKFNLVDSTGAQQPGYPKDNVTSTNDLISAAVSALQTALANTTTTTGGAMIGSLLTRDSGSAVTGAVPRTQAKKNYDRPSTKDLGMVGDSTGVLGTGYIAGAATDNTVPLQALLNNAEPRTMDLPIGEYLCKSAVSWTCTTSVGFGPSPRFSLHGADRNSVRLISGVAGTTTFGWTLAGSLANPGSNYYGSLSDLTFICALWNKSCSGLKVHELNYMEYRNLICTGFDTGMQIEGAYVSNYYNCLFVYNGDGFNCQSTGGSEVNVNTWIGCGFSNNSRWGFSGVSIGASLCFIGCRFEANGPKQTVDITANLTPCLGTGSSGGFYGSFDGGNGLAGPTFQSCYFEGNGGQADIFIDNTSATPMSVAIKGCVFNRLNSQYFSGQCIHIQSSGGGLVRVFLDGNAFLSAGSYVPSISFPFIYHDANVEIIDGGGNVYSELTSLGCVGGTGQYLPTHGVTMGGAVDAGGTANTLHNASWSITHTASSGIYQINHLGKGFGSTTGSYLASAMANGNVANGSVNSVIQNSATQFTVYTVNSAGSAADVAFSWTALRLG